MKGAEVELRSNGRAVMILERRTAIERNHCLKLAWHPSGPSSLPSHHSATYSWRQESAPTKPYARAPICSESAGKKSWAQKMFADSKTPQFGGSLSVCGVP
jgi:hypothetical protein